MSSSVHFEVFYGATDPAATHVYVRCWPDSAESRSGLKLAGVVRGPFSQMARTLPATVPLADQGPGESLLARAVLPDPCYWTPGAPYLYTVAVEVRRGAQVVAQAEHVLGVRPLGVAGGRFRLGGRGWFPRAIHQAIVTPDEAMDWASWREQGAVMIVSAPSDDFSQRASQQGVLLFAELPGESAGGSADPEPRRLAQWPAVGLVIGAVPRLAIAIAPPARRNVLFAQPPASKVDPASDCVIAHADDADQLAAAATSGKPVIAARQARDGRSLAAARAECDVLQADLAGRMEVAGLALWPASPGNI